VTEHTNKIFTRHLLKQNYRELILIFSAFTLMVLVSSFSIGKILRDEIYGRAEEIILTAGANVRVGLSEAETTLLNSYYIVQGMIEQNESKQEILNYLTATTEWIQRRDQGLLRYYGIYGYINGEFYDGVGINPGDDFIPQSRLWYQTAIRSGADVGYTTPYADWVTGDTILSAVRNIVLDNGDLAGILALDIDINWMVEYISSLLPAVGGYGMLLSQNMTLLVHPDSTLIGSQLHNLGGSYEEIALSLRGGGNIIARRIQDSNGSSVIVFFSRIFNGWYVGTVIPYFSFYRNLYISAIIMIVLGLVLSLSLCYILLRFSAAKTRADKNNESKSSFLASMSHEIRTPMNAITGMAEMLLRKDLPAEARNNVLNIKQAGNNLISIINDILDFSKIEAGKLEIIPAGYSLSSLINDTVNIVRMRITHKPIRFYTNIDSNIPNSLIGDEIRLRQIILNLLSNSAKYTEKGNISLTIVMEKRDSEQVWLKITVTDTGKGIKSEDLGKLFGHFVQVDIRKNRNIEGTGLGLAITKKLCEAMDGEINAQSVYGKGSVFTLHIPQGINSTVPFAVVKDAENKKVLVFERRSVYAKSLCWSLHNMGVQYTITATPKEFTSALLREEWSYVFSGCGLYEKLKAIMDRVIFQDGKKPSLALMAEWGTEPPVSGIRIVYLPFQCLSIANVLNGAEESKGFVESSGKISFTIPTARLLVVDDVDINLKVAEGLMEPYHATVDTCQSGATAIETLKRGTYDLVFMDHMMPDMDGITAVSAIREWETERGIAPVPIVALTANAVVGMKEMFIEKGFNDFLSKPIDVSMLDEILDRWIPEEKRVISNEQIAINYSTSQCSLPDISGIDIKQGIVLTGGKEDKYREILSLFCNETEKRITSLENSEDIRDITIQVHTIKSATANIGAVEISTEAAQLETACNAGDINYIKENMDCFKKGLTDIIGNIREALK
jgi:signal transduction histidine kinase/CheY-like chemotaxis protein/HPt (histidine-containing phosphotransfer) domain-containing protein